MNGDHAPSSIQEHSPRQTGGASSQVSRQQRSSSIEDYEIITEIGRGGTAIVYEAFHKSLRRRVALKQLPVAAALDSRWRERFHDEVHATSQLSHPNIVPFYELGQDDISQFYTMQLIDGISLAEVIRRLRQCSEVKRACMNLETDAVHPAFLRLCERCECRFACSDANNPSEPENGQTFDLTTGDQYQRAAVRIVRDAALAVDHAHEQGFLHLDIKPSNILIDTQGETWVTDFGAARSNNGATASEGLSGTLCYMSPEQALGREDELDARSDVYSLGSTLYELLTLERPFADFSLRTLVTQVSLGRFTPPRQVNKAISPQLDTIINKAMAREPDERYASARQLADDLGACLTAAPSKRTRREVDRGTGVMVAITLAVLLMLFATAPWQPHFHGTVYEWNGHYYALTENEVDWVSAEAEAVTHGGHLITINDEKEQAFVEKTFLTPPDSVFWIGMTDADKEGDWHWVSGEPVGYTNWENRGEPNNVIWRDSETGQTVDEDYGVINWHFIVEPPRKRPCTWNDINSVPNDDRVSGYRGIMEFESDP